MARCQTSGRRVGISNRKMSFLNKFIYSVGAVILALALIALFLPSQTNVRRGITIDASRATVFALINDFHQVNKWSHWLEDDPNARTAYSGPRRGAGARFAWDGNIVGRGSQTISESVPFERVVMALEFDDRGNATTVFELSETDEGTLLKSTFNMDIGFDLVARYVGLIVSGVIGENHEKGLENLKLLAEGLPRADFSDVEIEHIIVEAIDIAYRATSSIPDAAAISDAMGKAYFDILGFNDAADNQADIAGDQVEAGHSAARNYWIAADYQ